MLGLGRATQTVGGLFGVPKPVPGRFSLSPRFSSLIDSGMIKTHSHSLFLNESFVVVTAFGIPYLSHVDF